MANTNCDAKGRKYLVKPGEGGVGGGHMVCDGKEHVWIVPEFEKFGCLEETPVGPCPGEKECKPQRRISGVKKAKE